jgi:hypothetical protein
MRGHAMLLQISSVITKEANMEIIAIIICHPANVSFAASVSAVGVKLCMPAVSSDGTF